MSSSSTKSLVGCKAKTDDDRGEESGWTSYLEDFSFYNNNNNNSSRYSDHGDYGRFRGGHSLHSDAASPAAAWKEQDGDVACSNSLGGNSHHHHHQVFGRLKNLKKSRKQKSDPDLEDTATSPVNSPKVTVLKQAEIDQKKINENNIGSYSIR